MVRLWILITLSILSFSYCKKDDYSDKLVEIYARVELLPPSEAANYIKQYGLDDKENREKYYNMLRDLSSDREKWQEFLEKVDDYKKNVIEVERQKKENRN